MCQLNNQLQHIRAPITYLEYTVQKRCGDSNISWKHSYTNFSDMFLISTLSGPCSTVYCLDDSRNLTTELNMPAEQT